MFKFSTFSLTNIILTVSLIYLVFASVFVLTSITSSLFPNYFIYLVSALVLFILFSKVDFDIYLLLTKHLYVLSIVLLVLPLVIGQVTRGTIRWIPLGVIRIQPSELVRPFLLLYFANYLTQKELNFKRLLKAFGILLLPLLLIVIQPSLGVAVLTAAGFFGTLLASSVNKKYILAGFVAILVISPLLFLMLQPYQKQRITSFLDPQNDPYGSGYNSIQSMIAVGSGKLIGRGLGKGVQTQLEFLPEKHTDFIFAAIAEEMGFLGTSLVLLGLLGILWSLIVIIENPSSPAARSYVTGVFFVFIAETIIHIGMNMGLLPITGIPLPFVSAGGSALIGSTMSLAIAVKAYRGN